MMQGINVPQLALMLLIGIAVAGAIFAVLSPFLGSSSPEAKLKGIAAPGKPSPASKQSAVSRLVQGRQGRRQQVQESFKQAAERERGRTKGVGLRVLITRAGLRMSVRKYWVIALGAGLATGLGVMLLGFAWYVGILGSMVGLFGLPRWTLTFIAKRRQKIFLADLADAIDVMVRGLKAGLPLSDAMRIIASESGPPLGTEFMEVVEGQRIGITIEQGLERMFDRMPLPEVSFLGIAIGIQSKSGGNLSEALGNLSKVLRERKKLKAKVRSMSQEAKSSAFIIGSIPFAIVGVLFFINPDYMAPMFSTSTGNFLLIGCGVWMSIGILVMWKMINFKV